MAVFLVFIQVAQAGTITVDTDKGDNNTSDSLCSLAEAMQAAFDEGAFASECSGATAAPNVIDFSGSNTITLSVTLANVANELTIDGGAGQTIDANGGNSTFVLSLSTSDLTINNLTLQNGTNSAVRAQSSSADFAATNVVFDGNSANNGGAINGGDVVALTNVTFINNEATNGDGGAIHYTGSNLTITNGIFGNPVDPGSKNTASERGGAIYISNSTASLASYAILNGIFAHNTADGDGNSGERGGGAIFAKTNSSNGVQFSIDNSQFINNEATNGAGGAILLALNSKLGYPDGLPGGVADLSLGGIYRSNFINNTAGGPADFDGSGGAVYARGRLTVVQSSFINNSSSSAGGGAISFNGTSSHTLTAANTTFNGNSADLDGGAILNNSQSNIEIINSTIDGNDASGSGGGVFNDNNTVGDFSVSNSIVSNNIGGNCTGDPVSNLGNNLQFNPNLGCGDTPFDTGDPDLQAPIVNPGANLFVLTMELNDTSAALNAGDNATCSGLPIFNLDARGLPTTRPAGQPNCDIGAYESDFDPAMLDVTPNAGLAFGIVETGMTSSAMTATVTNTGGDPATNLMITFSGDFSAMTDNCTGMSLAGGANCTVDVIFSPLSDGMHMETLTATADGGLMNAINLTGTGIQPSNLEVTPDAGLVFGLIQTGTSSGLMTATVTNSGGSTATNLAITFTGDFSEMTDNCTGNNLASGNNCTVDVIFSPLADGMQTGTLTATASGGKTDAINLTGTGFTSAALDVTPDAGLSFGVIQTGLSSGIMTATVTNIGSVTADNLAIGFTGDFSDMTDNCTGINLAGGANCTVDVIFSPQSDGMQMGAVTATADGGLMDSISLEGTGFTPAVVDVTPDGGLAFGLVQTGTSSGVMTATVTNTGGQTAANLTIGFTGDFSAMTDNCNGISLAAGANCTVDVIFSPVADGLTAGTIMAMADGGLTDSINLSGTGFTPAVLDVTPDVGLDFGIIQTGASSGIMTAAVTNTGGQSAENLVIDFIGDFSPMTDNCTGVTLTSGANCTVDVIFTPQANGLQNGSLTATADGNITDLIGLSGSGFTPAGLDVTPNAGLDFGSIQTGTTSGAMTATVTNTGGQVANNLSVAFTGDFSSMSDNCSGTSLNGGDSCTVDIIFSPQANGMQTGTFTATADGGLIDAINLTGTGFTSAGLDVTPDAGLSFGILQTGSSSGTMIATVTNTGGQTANNLSIAFTGDFSAMTDNCSGTSLTGGSNCTVEVVFSPLADGMQTGSLTASADGNITDAINLTGTGVTAVGLDVTPDAGLDFGALQTGQFSAVMTATVANIDGSFPANNLAIALTGDFNTVTDNCSGNSLAVGGSCTVEVVFNPQSDGMQTGSLTATADGNKMDAINLSGTGLSPISITPSIGLKFGIQEVGATSAPLTATVANAGENTLANLLINVSGEFVLSLNNCPASLPMGESCTVEIRFTPSSVGQKSGLLTVSAEDVANKSLLLTLRNDELDNIQAFANGVISKTVPLTGTGVIPDDDSGSGPGTDTGSPGKTPNPTPIPTIGFWGLLILILSMALIGMRKFAWTR